MRKQGDGGSDALLVGVSDLHIHADPDVRARLSDEIAIAGEAKAAGYRSIMFKSNEWSCHDRAYLISPVKKSSRRRGLRQIVRTDFQKTNSHSVF